MVYWRYLFYSQSLTYFKASYVSFNLCFPQREKYLPNFLRISAIYQLSSSILGLIKGLDFSYLHSVCWKPGWGEWTHTSVFLVTFSISIYQKKWMEVGQFFMMCLHCVCLVPLAWLYGFLQYPVLPFMLFNVCIKLLTSGIGEPVLTIIGDTKSCLFFPMRFKESCYSLSLINTKQRYCIPDHSK